MTMSANITWTTDIATTGHVEYGITTEYGQVALSQTDQSSHTILFPDITPSTAYHFRVKAINYAGDITYSDDQTFTTPGLVSSNQNVSAPSATSNLSIAGHDETSTLLS